MKKKYLRFKKSLVAFAAAMLVSTPVRADPVSLIALAVSAIKTYGVYKLLFQIAVGVVLSADARRKQRKAAARQRAAYNASLENRSVTGLSALPSRRIVYGRAVTGGDIVAIFTSDKSAVRTNGDAYVKADAYKHLVIHVASHESSAINNVFIDGVPVGSLSASGFPTSGAFVTAGKVGARSVYVTTSHTFSSAIVEVLSVTKEVPGAGGEAGQYYASENVAYVVAGNMITVNEPSTVQCTVASDSAVVRIQKHLGSATQLADPFLITSVPGQWNTNDRLRGLTYIVLTLDLEDQRFQGGPPNVTVDLSGKIVFDGRTDTYAYSNNPALCIRDFLISDEGYGVDNNIDIDDALANAAANACDALITITTNGTFIGSPPVIQTNEKLYTCNGVFTSDDGPEAILEELAQSMAGDVSYSAKWAISAGKWTAPVKDLTDDDLHGQIEIVQCGTGLDELFNGVRASYVPAGTSVPTEMTPPYQNSVFVADDGAEIWTDEAYPFTDHPSRCRNLARIKTERARAGLVIRYPAKLNGWPLQVGDRVRVSSAEYGWTLKEFRITDWAFALTSAVMLTLQEDAAEIYDLADAAEADPTPNTGLPNPNFVAPVAGLTAVSGAVHRLFQTDGTSITRVKVYWNAITDAYVTDGSGFVEVRWIDAEGVWQTQRVPGTDTSMYITGFVHTQRLMIEVTVINGFGRRSFPIIVGHMVDGSTNLPSTGGTSVDRNLLKPGTWQLNTLGSQVGFLELATSGAGGSNAIVLAEQPDGSNGIVWRATSGTGALQQGGWETSPQYVVDPTKMYRSIVWVKVTGSAINGSYYHGPWVAGVNDMGGALNTNPYFQGGNRNTLPAGVWVLLVGYIYPASYAGAQANKGGVYRSDTGAKLSASPDYRWAASAAQGAHRAYQYYSSGAVGTNYQEFWGPRVELVDGNEQSIGSILASSALAAAAAAQATADGKIDSYWQAAPPGLASEGDLWFDTDDGLKQYRWTSGAWVVAADTRIGSAIANAATAQSTANQKIVSFVQAAPPTATSIGDLWFDLDDSFKLYRWNGSSWAVSSDTRIEIALTTAAAAQATADGKIDSFWQITAPATASEGDLWFDTDDNLKQYRWTSGAWVIAADTRIGAAILSAATAQATADGKIVSFVQASAPTATAVGDLWFDSDDGYKLYRWNGSWVAYQFDTGAIASGAATLVTSTTASALAIAGVISADTYTDITSTTFVSPITGHAHIVANGSFTYTTAGGESNIEFTTGLKVNGSAVVASGRTHIQASPGTGVVTRGTFTYTIRYPVTAGVTETFVVRGQKLGSGSTLVINNAETRVEVIKL